MIWARPGPEYTDFMSRKDSGLFIQDVAAVEVEAIAGLFSLSLRPRLRLTSFLYGVVLSTTDVPSLNLVLNKTLALLNMPSFNETTKNCDPLNLVRNNEPMFWVCDKSRAASTSSRMYMGAGLN